MTYASAAEYLREMAKALDGMHQNYKYRDVPAPMLSPDQAVGAAAVLCFIRDLVTVSPREDYNRVDILVLLEMLSRDQELFPCGVGVLIWEAE